MECVLYTGASYTPNNTGNFDLLKSTLFLYVRWYICVNRRACVFSTCSHVGDVSLSSSSCAVSQWTNPWI
jgi:hypothetical protein